jgi:small GTP-binding protein
MDTGEYLFKISFVGDKNVGKTSLILEQLKQNSKTEVIPSVHEKEYFRITRNGIKITIELWDTPSEDDAMTYINYYSQTNFFVICFACDNPISFANVKKKWYQEIKRNFPDIPIMLVSTKDDLKTENNEKKQIVKEFEAINMQRDIGAIGYLPTCAWSHSNVDEIFDQCVQYYSDDITLNMTRNVKNDKKNCCVSM